MELLARPLPMLQRDPEPVVMLSSLAADAPEGVVALPALTEPATTFENAWRDVQSAHQRASAATANPALIVETAELAKSAKLARVLRVTTEPAGARVALDDRPDPLCQTPCDIRTDAGSYTVRLALTGYKEEERKISVQARMPNELAVPMSAVRGSVIIEAPPGSVLKIDGTLTTASAPAEFALLPGLHSISADIGPVRRERALMVQPGARLRLQLKQ